MPRSHDHCGDSAYTPWTRLQGYYIRGNDSYGQVIEQQQSTIIGGNAGWLSLTRQQAKMQGRNSGILMNYIIWGMSVRPLSRKSLTDSHITVIRENAVLASNTYNISVQALINIMLYFLFIIYINFYLSNWWIGCPVQRNRKSICQQAERATKNQRPLLKMSRKKHI